ncbi:phosphoribosyltransferase-like protein [Porphyromonas gingivalis]|uniref:phosphoribosyltransferase-like protein n=1 Tax=Porphyromonas gingivalis TaxID=837 RepID=UPI000BE72C30|nr:hypothetical protein [Porphyromonas gingivalis]MDH7904171.1 hypothetical protein [Porphyromonas gingivalis]PDP47430.1 hypothetical protein CLI77_10395 [Porphyromonas gingivalis]
MILPSLDQQEYIEGIISTRLNSSIEYSHVLRWLSNFDDSEQDLAIEILSKIDYYPYDRILSVVQSKIKRIALKPMGKCIFSPIGESGKSGGSVLYICQQIQGKRSVYVNYIEEALNKLSSPNDVIVLVDDIIGSGNTFCSWLKEKLNKGEIGNQLNNLIDQSRIKLISIVVLEKGKSKINSEYPTIDVLGEDTRKLFLQTRSMFGGYVRMKRYREFCYKYGKLLYGRWPLGYENSQALIVFDHATPNNTLPIVWSDSHIAGRSTAWYPLFPRFAHQRVIRAKETMRDKRRELVLLRELFGYEEVEKALFKRSNLYLLQIVKLKLENVNDLTIRQALGVSQNYLEELFNLGVSKNLWDIQWQLTEQCRTQYRELKKKIAFDKTVRKEKELEASFYLREEIIYIPETVKGVK